MFNKIIQFSLNNKLIVLLLVGGLVGAGIFSASKIPLDAVPDITNNQVQIVSTSPTLAPQEMEQLITYPLEASLTNIPGVIEVRSISRYGLSVITAVFEEDIPIMKARQFVREQLNIASEELPQGLTNPELMPITTGLGEIYQYVLTVDKSKAHLYDAMALRTMQDWVIKRQLNGTPGIIEVSSFGGFLKQYEVSLQPELLRSYDLTISEVISAVEKNNENSGGSYIENGPHSFYIRSEGRVSTLEEISKIFIKDNSGAPVRISDVGEVRIGNSKRYGALTMDGQGEVVGGITLMLKGANSSEVLTNVQERINSISQNLPEGVSIYPYLDRSRLISKTIDTVKTNLIEGGLIVIFVLLLLLGNLRAGLIVASVIPLSMLFALTMMNYFGISANLMSLGAIDFGIVIDGAVIIVESLLHTLTLGYLGKRLKQKEMDSIVAESTSKIYRSAAFGVLIILVVFIPILTLEGVEGKTFQPMAKTVGFAILGSMLLSITYVPVMASIFLSKKVKDKVTFSDKIVNFLKTLYKPFLTFSLKYPLSIIIISISLLVLAMIQFGRLGTEFVPTLEEGDIAVQQSIKPGSSLQESIRTSTIAEKIILQNFPEVQHVVSKIGTAEVPTDPMAIEDADIMIIMKDKEEWTSASNREDLMAKMKEKLSPITWASYEFTQPIQLRFNELMTGSKADISVKIYGENIGTLKEKADEAAQIIKNINGAGDVKVDQTEGLQQLSIQYDRNKLAQFGINIKDVNQIIRTAYAGEKVGNVFEEERKFDLMVRLTPEKRQKLDLTQLTVKSNLGLPISLSEVATVKTVEGPMMISREKARRFINIGVNVRDRDVGSLVADIQNHLKSKLNLPPSYEIQYGGQFENLQNARKRLMVALPIALGLILLLLYFAFGSIMETLIIFMAVPLSAIGGIFALAIRGMPFSISSGVGFIALFGVSVLNGIVLLSAINQLKNEENLNLFDMIKTACLSRFRPVLMTALVAALGFLPMAISTGNGAEVQRPLATVVIGGLATSTLLTLMVLPAIYFLVKKRNSVVSASIFIPLVLGVSSLNAQNISSYEEALPYLLKNNPTIKNSQLEWQKEELGTHKIGNWSPLSFQYQGGQINYPGYDHFLTIEQDISPIFQKNLKNARQEVIEFNSAALKDESKLTAINLTKDLKLLFNDWYYWYSKAKLQDSILSILTQIKPVIQIRLENGEIDGVEYELFLQEITSAENNQELFAYYDKEAENNIRNLLFIPDSISMNPRKLELLDVKGEISPLIDTIKINSWYQNQHSAIGAMILENKIQAKMPSFQLGYFTQSLEADHNYHGFQLTVQIPIDKRIENTNVQQLKVQQNQIQNENQAKINELNLKTSQLKSSIHQLENIIERYAQNMSSSQDRLLEKVKQKYTNGEINFLEFSQIQRRIFQNQNEYLDHTQVYNEKVILLNYLSILN